MLGNDAIAHVFAYGSNMCTTRLRKRTPSALVVGCAHIVGRELRFHKRGGDGSAKADAYFTGRNDHVLWGVVFAIAAREKPALDAVEGLGAGYNEASVTLELTGAPATVIEATMYVADPSAIDPSLKPYSWYRRYVELGAREHCLPGSYLTRIVSVEAIEDPARDRHHSNWIPDPRSA